MATMNTNNKVYAMEVDAESTDLTGGVFTYAGLTDLFPFGFGTVAGQVRGIQNVAAPYFGKYRLGDRIYARDTGRTWLYLADNTAAPGVATLVLISEGSAQPAPTAGVGPDIVLVVADKVGKYAAFGLSSAVYQTLALAVAALPAAPASIMLLDDTYTLGAAQAIPTGTTLFSFSRDGVVITSAVAGGQGTLEPAGDMQLRGVRVTNTGAGAAIRPTGAGSILIDNASVNAAAGEGIDAATSNTATAVTLANRAVINSFLGGTSICSLASQAGCRASSVNLPTAGSSVTGVAASFVSLDCNGVVTLQQGDVSDVGATTPPTVFEALGTLIIGDTIAASAITLAGTRSTSATMAVATGAGGSVVCRNATFDPAASITAGTLVAPGSIVFTDGEAPALSAPNGVITTERAGVRGTIGATTLTMQDTAVTGAITAGVMTATGGSISAIIDLATSGVIRGGCEVTGQVTMGVASTSLLVERSSVHVAVAGVGFGAIHTINNCPVRLVDCYVRADDTLISVSSLGVSTVTVEGYVGGGCRFGTAADPVDANVIVSDVRAHSVRAEVGTTPSPGTYTFDGLFPTGGLIDMWTFSGLTASGAQVRIYSARIVPVGFELVVKNVDTVFGLDILPATSQSIDGVSTPITIGPNNFLRLRKVSLTAWTTC